MDHNNGSTGSSGSPGRPQDLRLYLPDQQAVQVRIQGGGERQYCYQKDPGKDYFHQIVPGEIYLETGDEKLCLNCALRRGVVTTDRLYWQRRTD